MPAALSTLFNVVFVLLISLSILFSVLLISLFFLSPFIFLYHSFLVHLSYCFQSFFQLFSYSRLHSQIPLSHLFPFLLSFLLLLSLSSLSFFSLALPVYLLQYLCSLVPSVYFFTFVSFSWFLSLLFSPHFLFLYLSLFSIL